MAYGGPKPMKTVVVSIKETGRDCWRVTYDGSVLGDSRGYRKPEAMEEARKVAARTTRCLGRQCLGTNHIHPRVPRHERLLGRAIEKITLDPMNRTGGFEPAAVGRIQRIIREALICEALEQKSDPILLTLPTPSFDALVETLHKARKGTTTVRVDVQALEALIVDHGRLLRATPHKEPMT
jgi:hypothetical protein